MQISTVSLRNVAFRLTSGEDLNTQLEAYLQKLGAGFLWLYGLQAQITSATLRFWDVKAQVYKKHIIQPPGHSRIEPGAISGNVTWVNGKPFAHIHGAFFSAEPAEQGKLLGGGHICELVAGRTLEGLIGIGDTKITRVLDEHPDCQVKTWRFPGDVGNP